jgi:hypothetical protein
MTRAPAGSPRVPESVTDPFARQSLLVAYHVRRFSVLYVAGLMGVLALAIFPFVTRGASPARTSGTAVAAGTNSAGSASGSATSGAGDATAGASSAGGSTISGASGQPGAGSSSGGGGTGTGAAGGTGGTGATSSGPVGAVETGTGVTRGGVACKPGVRQIPYSAYADNCVARFTGNNGGATTNGVTASTITIAVRKTSDAQGANALAAQAEGEAAGGVSADTNWGYIQQLVNWMNGQFELYGRKVKLQLFSGQGNGTNESLGQGEAQACADADTAVSSLHAFGDINWSGILESQPFSDCAARYHLYVPEGAAYYPESMYQQWNPYVWAIPMNCSLIAQEYSEWVGKQLAPFPAKWAGSDGAFNLNGRTRKFATYVPNNQGYQECVAQAKAAEEGTYHVAGNREDQYNYALDIATFPQDAQKAIVQFAADQDTTVILACDPVSPIFLTQDAVQQNYTPEWALIGVALTDTDNFAQLWDQQAITGHLFGLSQNASTAEILNPNGEAGKALASAGVPLNGSAVLDYVELLSMFNQLQIAGPDLTAANIAANTPNIPVGTGLAGTWDFGHGHTAISDSRQIYWNATAKSQANGKTGTYEEVYGGQRFRVGQFPTTEPPYYP